MVICGQSGETRTLALPMPHGQRGCKCRWNRRSHTRSPGPTWLGERSRIEQPAHGFNTIGRYTEPASMIPDQLFICSEVDAINFIIGDETPDPSNIGSH